MQRRKAAKEVQYSTVVEFVFIPAFLCAFASLRRDFQRLSALIGANARPVRSF
jgi:hypothetical protein